MCFIFHVQHSDLISHVHTATSNSGQDETLKANLWTGTFLEEDTELSMD